VPDVDGRSFVVQRHRARRLHYDLRLQIDGVLVSWAVPKGPALDPMVRRAAFHVEDHPLDYFDFEGIIPVGGYGGGDVIVWDAGTWRPGDGEDPRRAVETGELHFDLEGQKLRGRFVLVRTRTDARTDGSLGKPRESGKEQWLLLHKNDEFAVHGWIPRTTRARCSADAPTTRSRQTRTGSGDPIFPRRARRSCCVRPPSRARPTTSRTHRTRSAGPVPGRFSGELNMHRYPNGALAKGFWQKELPRHPPEWLPRWDNPDADPGERRTYLVVDEPAALVWAANFGALEWHPWTSPVDSPHRPSYALIDLDPGTATSWADLLVLARLHRTAFEHLKLVAQAKLTGRRGIQIWVPVAGDLGDPRLAPDRWTIRTIGDRLAERGDLFRPVLQVEQTLPRLR